MKYNFYNYLSVTIKTGSRKSYIRYFENEYKKIDSPASGKSTANITLEIVKELPHLQKKPTTIHRTDRFKKLFSFEYVIDKIDNNNVHIYFKHHWVANVYVTAVGVYIQAHILEPLMYLKLLEQQILFMHSAGASINDKGYIFPAYGGTGKTTLSLSLVRNGFSLLGDDLLIVDPNIQTVYPYQRPLHLFTYNINNLKGAQISASLKAVIYFKNIARFFLEKILQTEFLISTRVHADAILPDIRFSKPVKYDRIFFLKKTGKHEDINLIDQKMIKKHALAIANSADLNESLFKLLQNDPTRIGAIKEQEIIVISEVLKKASAFGYINTRLLDLDKPSELIRKLID